MAFAENRYAQFSFSAVPPCFSVPGKSDASSHRACQYSAVRKKFATKIGKFCTVRVCISLTICNVTNVSSTSSAKVAPQV